MVEPAFAPPEPVQPPVKRLRWGRLCKRAKQKYSPTVFQNQARLNSYEVTAGAAHIGFGHASTATVIAQLHLSGAVTRAHKFDLVREDGEWRVCE